VRSWARSEPPSVSTAVAKRSGRSRDILNRLDELCRFGSTVCRVKAPRAVLGRIAQAMSDTLALARQDRTMGVDAKTAQRYSQLRQYI